MDELELSEYQKHIEEMVAETPSPGKHSARMAIRYMKRAWRLRNIDKEFAIFALITGQEEAVTAIIHSVQRRGYEGADKLDRWRHPHKWAVIALLEAIGESFQKRGRPDGWKLRVVIDKEVVPYRVQPRIVVPGVGILCPVPPLDMKFTDKNGNRYDYKDELSDIATASEFKSIQKYIDNLANERNRLLYAGSQGMPTISGELDTHISESTQRVFSLLSFYMMIDPYKEKQALVQDAIDALLPTLQRVQMPKPAD